ncbi:MAG: AAA family ATPase [Clostridia bacterium]|nr:AAA family ATPase [Clostridia bacterium]
MENIIGHEKVKIILKKIIDENKVGHAYMFVGKEGIGKKLVAIAFAKQIMNLDGSTFNESDFKIILPENDLIKVEQIRKIINEVYLKPVYSKHKVIVIDDADKMNANAQNALLKVLEEPPMYATLILVVSNKEKIIKTILSRVTEITFDNLTNQELEKIVGKAIDLDYARGSASKALSLLEGNYYEMATQLITAMDEKDFLKLNKKMTEAKQSDVVIVKLLEMIKIMYHKNMKEDTYAKIKKIELLDDTIKNLNRNANADLALDKLMIEICRV